MKKDQLAKVCSGCGRLIPLSQGLPVRAKVPAFKSRLGTVRGWWAYACTPECLVTVRAGIAKDQVDCAAYLAQGQVAGS